jgi:hypothetical protein
MARFTIANNAQINLLTQQELGQELDRAVADLMQEEARGYTTAPIRSQATISGAKVSFPPTGDQIGPEQGFAWRVNRLTLLGLSTNDQVSVFKNDTNTLVDIITVAKPAIYPGKGLIMRGMDRLLLQGSGLTATGDLILNGEAVEVAELDIRKLH